MIDHIGVVGSGTMGLEIALCYAQASGEVTICDVSEEIIQAASGRLQKKLAKLVERGKIESEARDAILSRIRFTTRYEDLSGADLIAEAILEDMDIKKQLYQKLDAICGKDVIFASNTSALSITEMSLAVSSPERFVGMHFFNPASSMKLVEIIKGMFTSEAVFAKVKTLSEELGKTPVAVNESPGFVVNRILIPMINEAVGIYADQTASAEDIDTAMRLGANHPMGPLALGDLIGWDVCLSIMETLFWETGDSKYRPHPMMRRLVRAKLLGRKSGRGVYTY